MTTTITQFIAAENAFEAAITKTKIAKPTKAELFELTPLTMLPIANPKKPGTMSYDRFQGYFTPGIETVGDAFAAGLRMDDIRHDSNKGFIKLGETPEA